MYNGIYVAEEERQTVTAANVLIALQVPASTQIEILRAWCSPALGVAPTDEMQEIELYKNTTNLSTGGAALTEEELRGNDDAATSVTALGGATIGASSVILYPDGFHLQNGWLYLPIPEERIRIVGATTSEFGLNFPLAPESASEVLSYGIIWGEIG